MVIMKTGTTRRFMAKYAIKAEFRTPYSPTVKYFVLKYRPVCQVFFCEWVAVRGIGLGLLGEEQGGVLDHISVPDVLSCQHQQGKKW